MQNELTLFRTIYRASPVQATLWWTLLLAGGILPVAFAVATGVLVRAITEGSALAGPLGLVGGLFVAMQVVNPVHVAIGQNLGRATADHMNDRLMRAAIEPDGIAHLENPELTHELTMARDFDLGILGPPLFIAMSFIADGLRLLVVGTAAAVVLFGFAWWAPLVLVTGWGSTHWLLRESGVWRDRNTETVRKAQRHADYAYRLAVDAPAAKEMRLFGLADWVVARFMAQRTELYDLQWQATRLRERSVVSSLIAVTGANALVFWQLAAAALSGAIDVAAAVVFFQTAIGVSAIAFGGLSWAMDSASAPAVAVDRLVALFGSESTLEAPPRDGVVIGKGPHPIRFENVTFAYPTTGEVVLRDLDLEIEPGTSLAIVGRNGAGKTTLAKLLCRFYDPTSGAIEIAGRDLRQLDPAAWRRSVVAVFQDFVRYELTLRENVAPRGAPDDVILESLRKAGADGLADLDTPLSKAYPGGTDLSGGQWQRIALARAICGVALGADLVLLDEPTAQLDVRGEMEIFRRLLDATSQRTTIIVSHRFSTVRLANRIAVVEDGRVVELGTHAELMAMGGRYRTMYELQAQRFVELDDHGEEVVLETLD